MDEFIKAELIEIAQNVRQLKISIDCSRAAMDRRNGQQYPLVMWQFLLDNITKEEKLLELSIYKIAEWFRTNGEDFGQSGDIPNGKLIGFTNQ